MQIKDGQKVIWTHKFTIKKKKWDYHGYLCHIIDINKGFGPIQLMQIKDSQKVIWMHLYWMV